MSLPEKPKKRTINGVLLLNKARGISSNQALQQIRHLYRAEKAGHTGVLDPLATGLLPICFGEATKFAQYLLDADKGYLATLKLGEKSNTGDAEGDIIATTSHLPSEAEFTTACQAHLGAQQQIPPMYSALKHQGKALYEYARKGLEIARPARDIAIYELKIEKYQLPEAKISVLCSKGTYIRTLAEDIAQAAQSLAHLTALHRTQTAGFDISQAYLIEALEEMSEEARESILLPCDSLVQHLPSLTLPTPTIRALQHGQQPESPTQGLPAPPHPCLRVQWAVYWLNHHIPQPP